VVRADAAHRLIRTRGSLCLAVWQSGIADGRRYTGKAWREETLGTQASAKVDKSDGLASGLRNAAARGKEDHGQGNKRRHEAHEGQAK